MLPHAVEVYYALMPAELSTNLSRMDGIKYGMQDDTMKYETILDYYTAMRTQGFGDETKRRILLGTYVLSSENYEQLYLKAQQIRQKMIADFDRVFLDYDVIIGPTTPTVAWKMGETAMSPLQMYMMDMYTIPANLA